jgi:hypothetical protein
MSERALDRSLCACVTHVPEDTSTSVETIRGHSSLSMVMHAGRANRQPVPTAAADSRRAHRGGYARAR